MDDERSKVEVEAGWQPECRSFDALPWEMCRIPAGRLETGGSRIPFEPVRWQDVEAFYLAVVPVTNVQYEQFDPGHLERRDDFSPRDDSPATSVSWHEAQRYLEWLSARSGFDLRLPGASMWQFACHGGRPGRFPWGPPLGGRRYRRLANIGTPRAVAVGSFPSNGFGLYDMAGNVEEWCEDPLVMGPDGQRLHPGEPGYDSSSDLRVAKNCSAVFANPFYCGCEMLSGSSPKNRSEHRGFRVAMSDVGWGDPRGRPVQPEVDARVTARPAGTDEGSRHAGPP